MATTSAAARAFILVMSVSPHHNGGFGRAGYRFSRTWRPLEIVAEGDIKVDEHGRADSAAEEQSLITPTLVERLKAESFLAVKDASASEVDRLLADRAAGAGMSDADRIAKLESDKADLESRLMKLELGASGDAKGKGGKTTPPAVPPTDKPPTGA